jgi:hypothetical protein
VLGYIQFVVAVELTGTGRFPLPVDLYHQLYGEILVPYSKAFAACPVLIVPKYICDGLGKTYENAIASSSQAPNTSLTSSLLD